MAAQSFELIFSAVTAGAQSAINNLRRSLSSVQNTAQTTGAAVGRMSKSFSALKGIIAAVATGMLAGKLVSYGKELVGVADQYAQLDAKIKLATKTDKEAAAVKKQLYEVSQQTGTAYRANADAFAKLGMTMKEMGADGRETVQIVEMINKSLAVNGSDAASAASFQLQFAQAMGSGVLQGDEFRAMLESNGYFAQLLAKQLGTNVAGLRQMSSQGKLTTDVLRNAFPGMAEEINKAFASLPLTTDRALTAIRNTWESIIDESNKASGSTGKIAKSLMGLNHTIESNRDNIQNLLSSLVTLGARFVEVSVHLGEFILKMPTWVKDLGAVVALTLAFAGTFKTLSAASSLVLSIFVSFVGVLRSITVPMAALNANILTYAAGVKALGGGVALLRLGLKSLSTVAIAAFVGWEIGSILNELSSVQIAAQRFFHSMEEGWLMVKMAWAKAFGTDEEVQAIGRQIDAVEARYRQARAEIEAQSAGSVASRVANEKKVADATKITTDAIRKASAEAIKLTDEELKERRQQYRKFVEEIRDIEADIAGRQKSLQAELREMGRSGMSDYNAWQDRKREAEEYMQASRAAAEAARQAMAQGDTITAREQWKASVALIDDAKNAYKELNTEVKSGDTTLISKTEALKAAMSGVKEAGELSISVLKERENAFGQVVRDMEKNVGLDKLMEGMDEAEKKWLESWRRMSDAAGDAGKEVEQVYKVWKNAAGFWTNTADAFSAGWSRTAEKGRVEFDGMWAAFEKTGKDAADKVNKALDAAVSKKRTATIDIATRERRQFGGPIGAFRTIVGRLPGYGGGDRISALLEQGEFVVRKEAVRKFGAPLFEALNSLRLPDLSALLPVVPVPALAAGGAGSRMTLELRLPGGDSVNASVSGDDAERLRRWNRRVSHLGARR